MNKRYLEVDVLRGLAVVLMIGFHFGYDLAYYGYAHYKTTVDIEWVSYRIVILSLFLLCVGMSAYLSYRDSVDWQKLHKRVVKLSVVALLISVVSYFVFPYGWIYFGVIHFIVVASVLSIWFVRVPQLSLFLGMFILISYNMGYFHFDATLNWAVKHLNFPVHTVDVVSFTPWFGAVLIGIYLMHKQLFGWQLSSNRLTQKLSWVGQNALVIYLVHQPILFAGFETIKWMGK